MLIEKLESNIQELRADVGELYAVADVDIQTVEGKGAHILNMPKNYGLLLPEVYVVPLQLQAYHAALAKGADAENGGIWRRA